MALSTFQRFCTTNFGTFWDQILALLSEAAEDTELNDLASRGAKYNKVAGAPFGHHGSNLTADFEGNADSFRAADR